MKVSFVATVFNEEETIDSLLASLSSQTKKADEIVIVDAGSSDSTLEILKKYSKRLPLKVYVKKGNRSVGRNFGIQKASGQIISITDAGCIPDRNWIKKITLPLLSGKSDVSAGFYKPVVNNIFEKSLAAYTCVPSDKVTKDFLPSSRSIAFTKISWKTVGGYPEELDTCEDLVFANRLKKKKLKFEVVKEAFVKWPQRSDILEAAEQFYSYAKGDGKAGYIRPQTPFLFGRYIVGVLLILHLSITKDSNILMLIILLLILYLVWAINKNYKYVKHILGFFYLPLLQIISDICVISGTSTGIVSRLFKI